MTVRLCISQVKSLQFLLKELLLVIPDPGVIAFEERGILVKESVGSAQIPVSRKNGADGDVTVRWRTLGKQTTK